MNNYVVYCHVSPDGKRYVGISCNPEKRWNNGKGYIKNYLFYPAIKKYGWDNFQHLILYNNLDINIAKNKEKQLIKEWNLTNPKYGYNLRSGGDGPFTISTKQLMSKSRLGNKNSLGRILTIEQKDKISKSLKEYYKTHQGTFKGKHHTEETKNKLKNRIVTNETREKMKQNHADVSGANNPSAKAIRQLDINGNIIEEFAYASLAATKYHLVLSSIIKCCRGKQKTCGGYKWEYI